jgi:hypothetical protein
VHSWLERHVEIYLTKAISSSNGVAMGFMKSLLSSKLFSLECEKLGQSFRTWASH